MKPRLQASRVSALLSGLAVGMGMPILDAVCHSLGLSHSAHRLVFVFGLVFLFFAPVLLFVAGTEHLSMKSREMAKLDYWRSLGKVAIRSVFWLIGGGLGFGLLSAVRGLSS